jgi:hypothetical protein
MRGECRQRGKPADHGAPVCEVTASLDVSFKAEALEEFSDATDASTSDSRPRSWTNGNSILRPHGLGTPALRVTMRAHHGRGVMGPQAFYLNLRGDHVRFGPDYYRPTIVAKPWPRALHEMLLLFQTKAEDLM